jgi:hypothetical protein
VSTGNGAAGTLAQAMMHRCLAALTAQVLVQLTIGIVKRC